jgi:drug/metabolite transporter (DMT)-like permease
VMRPRDTSRAAVPWQAQYVLLSCIWGLSFYFMKLGNETLDPIQVSFGRMIVGTAVLALIVAVRREALPRSARAWGHLLVTSALFNSVPMTLYAWSETRVSSIVAGIWNGTTPLFVLLVVVLAFPDDRPTRERVAGLLVGFAGVVVVLGPWSGLGGQSLAGNLAGMAAAMCYGVGYPYMRRHVTTLGYSGIALSFGQILCAMLSLAVVTPLVTAAPSHVSGRSIAAVCLLGALGTGFAYVLQYAVLRAVSTTTASTVTYVIPVVSTVAGLVLLGERLSWNEPVGAVVVLAGIAIGQGLLRYTPGRTRPRAAGRP